MDRPDDAPPLPEIHHVTEGWHELGASRLLPGAISTMLVNDTIGRVCEHWVSYDAPASVPVQDKEGRTLMAGPGPVRSYVGLVLEVADAQIQVRGRLRLGGERLAIELIDS